MVAALSPANTATVTSGGSCFGLRVIPNFIFWRDSSCGAAVSAMVFIGVHCPEERSRHPVVSRVCGLISSLAALIPRLRWGLCLLCGPLRLLHRRCGRCCGLDRNHRARVLCCWRTCLNRLCRRLRGRWRVCLRRWSLGACWCLRLHCRVAGQILRRICGSWFIRLIREDGFFRADSLLRGRIRRALGWERLWGRGLSGWRVRCLGVMFRNHPAYTQNNQKARKPHYCGKQDGKQNSAVPLWRFLWRSLRPLLLWFFLFCHILAFSLSIIDDSPFKWFSRFFVNDFTVEQHSRKHQICVMFFSVNIFIGVYK